MASGASTQNSRTQSSTTRELPSSPAPQELTQEKKVVFDCNKNLLDNFTVPKPPDGQYAVYYEFEENVSASNEQLTYGDDKCFRLPLTPEDSAEEGAKIPSEIVEAIANGPQRRATLQVVYAKPSFYHEYSTRIPINWNAGSLKIANMWLYVTSNPSFSDVPALYLWGDVEILTGNSRSIPPPRRSRSGPAAPPHEVRGYGGSAQGELSTFCSDSLLE